MPITLNQLRKLEKGAILIADLPQYLKAPALTPGNEYEFKGASKANGSPVVRVTNDNGATIYYGLKNFSVKP